MRATLLAIHLLFLASFTSLGLAQEEVPEADQEMPAEESPEQDSVDNATERVGAIDEASSRQNLIAESAQKNEVVWLDVMYPNEEEARQVLALQQQPRVPKDEAQGAVLLLHDRGQHADWPYLIKPLRIDLPDKGWYTFSVNLPYGETKNIPARSLEAKEYDAYEMTDAVRAALQKGSNRLAEPSEQSGEMEDSEPAEEGLESDTNETSEEEESVDIDLAEKEKAIDYRELAKLHIDAAMNHIRGKGYGNIVIVGYRAGADFALDHIKPRSNSIKRQGFALVMIDPRIQFGYQTDLANALGQNFKAPVLDVVNSSELDGRTDAAERDAGARIAGVETYRQIRVVWNETNASQKSLVKRIGTWLEKYAPGMAATQYQRNQ